MHAACGRRSGWATSLPGGGSTWGGVTVFLLDMVWGVEALVVQ